MAPGGDRRRLLRRARPVFAAGLEPGTFVNGYAVSRASVERLPADAVGRVLALADLMALVEGKKKPPAPSARRSRGAGGIALTDSNESNGRGGNAIRTEPPNLEGASRRLRSRAGRFSALNFGGGRPRGPPIRPRIEMAPRGLAVFGVRATHRGRLSCFR